MVFSYLVFKNRDPEFILYLFIGVITWMFFSEGSKKGMKCLNAKRYLIENVQLNKLDIFYSTVITSTIGFCFNLFIYLIFSCFFSLEYSWHIIVVPLIIFNLILTIFAVSLILATLYIYFKDLDHVWDIVLLIGFWTVPIIWDQKFIFEHYSFMLYTTPITGILINFRQIFLYNQAPIWELFVYDYIYAILAMCIGLFIFKKFSLKAAEIR
jgi:ABC-type polysaccharide/polyol phosphate export permease|tara:strand:+ start:10985 stop:11617 length:633 start_codon:yes stop_codon:yes gene_type:complete